MIIINTPHNPLGKVMDRAELEVVANLCKKWNVLCVSDEVYEHMVFEPFEHIRICTLPGMWERTITIGSAGRFPFLVNSLILQHDHFYNIQFLTFSIIQARRSL